MFRAVGPHFPVLVLSRSLAMSEECFLGLIRLTLSVKTISKYLKIHEICALSQGVGASRVGWYVPSTLGQKKRTPGIHEQESWWVLLENSAK